MTEITQSCAPLYEVWLFITRRARHEDLWYAEHNIPHEPCLCDEFQTWASFRMMATVIMGYQPGRDSDKMLNRKNHNKPFSPENCYFCDHETAVNDCDTFFRNLTGATEAPHERCKRDAPKSRGGRSNTRLYDIWRGMKRRCQQPTCKDYPEYGGRGIKVCDEWASDFDAFYTWAWEHGYNPELSLDRRDVNEGYTPSNCRWATQIEQNCNRTDTDHLYRTIRLTTARMRKLLEELPDSAVLTLIVRRDVMPDRIVIEDDYAPVPPELRIDKPRKG